VQITIDNLDGMGPLDYSGAVAVEGPVTLQRTLNAPSRCTAEIVVGAENRKLPVRRARVVVTSRRGMVLFTGYLATEPVRIYAGTASTGPVYRARITAVSDEWVLDNLGSGGSAYDTSSFNLTGEALLRRLVQRTQSGTSLLPVAGTGTTQATGAFTPNTAEPWSVNASSAANSAYASYRAIGGQVLIQPVGTTTHGLSDANGTLSVAELSTSAVRELANDVMLTGAEEPAAYIAENFVGDGTTTVFSLSGPAYRSTQRTLLRDSFNQSAFDVTQWAVADPGSHLSLTGAGLTMNGGNGTDGATTVTALDVVEMGGSVVAQLSGVSFNAASDGMLAGFYQGTSKLANCFAGFRVRQNSGTTVLVPVVNGAEVGTVFTPATGHSYTLRLRLYCPEMQRVMQPYYCMVDGVLKTFGSSTGVAAPMDFVFELTDEGMASNTPATVLYDSMASGGTAASSPATCAFVAVNSTQLYGAIASLSLTRPGSMWVLSTLPNGTQTTRLVGIAGQGADCVAEYGSETGTPGKVTFFAGRAPVAGERVTVFLRGQQRSVSRIADAASLASEAAGGAPGTARWLGKVLQPAARSSADCENAAMAVLAMSTSRTAALSGSYTLTNPKQDIWPGDVLAMTSDGVTSSVLVRTVVAKDMGALPETIVYDIGFANGWAAQWEDGIGLRLSESIATDAYFPLVAATGPAQVLANLSQLKVTSLTPSAITMDAGTDPPAGGGFEVRRKDWFFGSGVDAADLVLRSPVRSFSIPRAAQVEQFYVRAYDASTPPLYSRFSSAVCINAPTS
jgi:hypothetical protein